MITNEQVTQLALILERRIPLLSRYSPDGWQDFRDGVPTTLRCGLYVSAYDNANIKDGSFGPSEPPVSVHGIRFKTRVGGRLAAYAISNQLHSMIPAECFTSAVKVLPAEEGKQCFVVHFELDKGTLEELIAILDPAPGRQFPTVLRISETELDEMNRLIDADRKQNSSWATVPAGALRLLLQEVRDRRLAEKDGL